MFAIVYFAESSVKTIKVVNVKWIKNFNPKTINYKKCVFCFFSDNVEAIPNFNCETSKEYVSNKERVYKVFVRKIVGE